MNGMIGIWIGMLALALPPVATGAAENDPGALYRQHCASCHGGDRLGGVGPALLPENLGRLKKAEAEKVIREGRPATQMPAFGDKLSAAETKALAELVYTPVTPLPAWGEKEIQASRIVHADAAELPGQPRFEADPMNLFVVVESGDHHVSILDGDKLEPIFRFPSRYALHGGPKFSPEGRFVYFASRDGWISKFDLWNLTLVAEVRAGLNTRNAAVSGDGKYVAVANYLPHTIVVLDADLKPVRILPAADLAGQSSRVSAIYDAGPRHSFVAALKDVKEAWEISYDPKAEPVFDGYVHDYRMGEGLPKPGFLNPRRIPLDDYLDDFFFSQDYRVLLGASRGSGTGKASGQVVNLDIRRKIADLDLPGMPHLGSGISWTWQGRRVMATPNLNEGVVSVIDTRDWRIIRNIPTLGPGFFLRSHEKSRYAWVDSMMSREHKDTLQVIDKDTLEVVANLRPEPGKTLAHVEFTRDGRFALASLGERRSDGGAIIVFDGNTLKEVKRIPMDKPVGKYNVENKISRSEGTSH